METIAIRLAPEDRQKLKRLSRLTGLSRATLVGEAVRRFLDTELSAAEQRAAQGENGSARDPLRERWNVIV